MKFSKHIVLFLLLAWFVGAFFLSWFWEVSTIQFPSSQSFSSIVRAMLINSLPFSVITTLPVLIILFVYKISVVPTRIGIAILLLLSLDIFFAGRSGIFTLSLFPNYPLTVGSYSAELYSHFFSREVHPSFTFKTKDKAEAIINFYQPILMKKGMQIEAPVEREGGEKAISRYIEVFREEGQYTGSAYLVFGVVCDLSGRRVSDLAIAEDLSGSELTSVRFFVTQGGSLLSPLTPCI